MTSISLPGALAAFVNALRRHPTLRSGPGVLALAALLAAGQAATLPARAQPHVGMQGWTFRYSSLAEVLDAAQKLGIHYVQAFPGERIGEAPKPTFDPDMDAATRAKVLAMAKAKGVTIYSYGAIWGYGISAADWEKIFAFAKAMGLHDLGMEATEDMLPLINRLSLETGIKVGIHNHPPPDHYANPDTVLAAVKPYGPNLGFCADTGHWARSGFDPVASLRKAEGRIISVHFKDESELGTKNSQDVPWGTGASNAAGQIAELLRQHYDGIVYIEYEHRHSPTFFEDLAHCVKFFRQAVAQQNK